MVIGPEFNSVRFALVGGKVKMETKDNVLENVSNLVKNGNNF
jgi:hypothetical protein